MKLYLDTGNLDEVRDIAQYGILDGVTTNPSLIAKEEGKFETIVKKITEMLSVHIDDFTVSAEVTAEKAEDMVKEGIKLSKIDKHVIIKVPLTPEGIKATTILTKKKIRTNVTLCFSANQALLAAKAGAFVVSPFVGRLDDRGQDGMGLIAEIRTIFDNYGFRTGILAASIREPLHVAQAAEIGADIATVPYKVFKQLFNHPLTDEGLKKFLADWKKRSDKGSSKKPMKKQVQQKRK